MSFTAALVIGGKNTPGLPVSEFVDLVNLITKKHGKGVMIGECDKDGHMHLSLKKKHLGYINVNTGSLVWDD